MYEIFICVFEKYMGAYIYPNTHMLVCIYT